MYLEIGGETLIRTESILGIFDLDNTTVGKSTREYLNEAEKTGFSKTVSYDLPKSFLVTVENNDRYVYISPYSTVTVFKRLKNGKTGTGETKNGGKDMENEDIKLTPIEDDNEEQMNTAVTETYDASQIQVLEGLEAVRKRPGMYIGSTGPKGLHHLVYEIVDNSVDEALAGYCTHIEVEILPGDIITVRDNGRGIPVDINEQQGLPAVTVVLTVLHAGGKFGGSGYKVSGGLHGVGSSVVNALSEWFEIEVSRDGHIHRQRFERGNIASDLEIVGDTDKTGTFIRFKADPEIFKETTVYEYDVLERRLREQAFLNAGLSITLTDKRDEGDIHSEEFCYEGGIRSFVDYINKSRGLAPVHEDIMHFSTVQGDKSAEVAISYNDGYNEIILSFANDVRTIDGGTHEQGFKNASRVCLTITAKSSVF